MVDDIKLRLVGEEKPELPRGIHMVSVGDDRIILVRRSGGRLMPIPGDEEMRIAKELGWIDD
jgi:hypothetical protein